MSESKEIKTIQEQLEAVHKQISQEQKARTIEEQLTYVGKQIQEQEKHEKELLDGYNVALGRVRDRLTQFRSEKQEIQKKLHEELKQEMEKYIEDTRKVYPTLDEDYARWQRQQQKNYEKAAEDLWKQYATSLTHLDEIPFPSQFKTRGEVDKWIEEQENKMKAAYHEQKMKIPKIDETNEIYVIVKAYNEKVSALRKKMWDICPYGDFGCVDCKVNELERLVVILSAR